jgi:tetratricopeptide (TPR) repeat protein
VRQIPAYALPARAVVVVACSLLAIGALPAGAFAGDQTSPQDSLPPELRAARAALDAGDSREAVRIAERYMWGHQSDPRGHILVGDGYAARLPAGLVRSVRAYRAAIRLDQANPEPHYKLAQVGIATRGDNGEALAAEGLERVLELDPTYEDAWEQWLTGYRSAGGRQDMLARLAPHDSLPAVRAMIGRLFMEEERYAEAEAFFSSALAADSVNVAWVALRAQSALESGDADRGLRYYDDALALAAHDTSDALWTQVVGIATPAELLAWARGVAPEDREAWFRAFWARRNPDLFVNRNLRIVEHFSRLRYARANYPLLHPFLDLDYTVAGQALTLPPDPAEQAEATVCEGFEFAAPRAGQGGLVQSLALGPGDVRYRPMMGLGALGFPTWGGAVFFPISFDLGQVGGLDTVSAKAGYNLATGLSDRGLTYLRLGPPDEMLIGADNSFLAQCVNLELVRWRYREFGELRFNSVRAFGSRTAAEIGFQPRVREQFDATMTALTEDHSSVPAPAEFGVWTAQFRNTSRPASTDVAAVTTHGKVAAALVPLEGSSWESRESSSGIVVLAAQSGSYSLLVHARIAETLGRQTLRVQVRSFDRLPATSDMLLGRAWTSPVADRREMLQHVQRDLTFNPGDTVRSYAELYGLSANEGGVFNFRVVYLLLKTDDVARDYTEDVWPDALRFEFDRQVSGPDPAIEVLDILPQWIPRGRYVLRLEVEDLEARAPAGRATVALEVR